MVIYDFLSMLEYICKLIILKIIIYKFILNGIMGKIKINLVDRETVGIQLNVANLHHILLWTITWASNVKWDCLFIVSPCGPIPISFMCGERVLYFVVFFVVVFFSVSYAQCCLCLWIFHSKFVHSIIYNVYLPKYI